MVHQKPKPTYVIEQWSKLHDSSAFTSDLPGIKKYIQEQAHRDTASFTSSVFVLTESGHKVILGYYSLSSISIVFNEIPQPIQKKLPRYPETSAILLGRLGVDKVYSIGQFEDTGEKPRLGEKLLVDAQRRSLASTKEVGSALMIIDAEMPSIDEMKNGARDPLPFYIQYGFAPLTDTSRRVAKSMRAIAKEFGTT